MNSSSLDTALKSDISRGFTVRFQDFHDIFYGFLRLPLALYIKRVLLCEWRQVSCDGTVWGFCAWYPQIDVVGERSMEADRHWNNGMSIISYWMSGPGRILWVWASGAGMPQGMDGPQCCVMGVCVSGVAALRPGSQMYESCAIDRPVMSTLKYWKGACLLPSMLRCSLWPWAMLMLSR